MTAQEEIMTKGEGCYIYGIIGANHRQEFGPIGIGGRGDVVYTLPYQDVAAIISRSPIVKYPVSRENTIAHAKVLEKVVEEYTVLPVRFCTISDNDEIIVEKLLKTRYQEFMHLLRKMCGKSELGIRARWIDLNAIFTELVEENEDIKALKDALLVEINEQRKYANSIKIGLLVQKALAEKRKREAEELLEALRPLSLDCKEMQFYGDMNLVNAAFLVDREKQHYFDQKMNELEKVYKNRKQLKYTYSMVPYNFVKIVVYW
jgi:hypothetical protein